MFAKTLLVKVLLSVFLSSVCYSQAVAPKYPAIKAWTGQAWLTGKDGKRQPIRRKQVLREKALIETSLSSEVVIDLDPQRSFTVLGNTELSLPVIGWESGESPVVLLKRGDLQWSQTSSEKPAYNVALRSDLFEFLAPPGSYVLYMRPDQARAGVKMYSGSMEFSAMNAEDVAKVKAGQEVAFQGVLESGEIAYDLLLKGKRIPKGKLTGITALDPLELEKIAAEKKKKEAAAAKVLEQKKKAAAKSVEGMVCSAPFAKFNECAWICLNNPKKEKKDCLVKEKDVSCVRRRCNANGEWADELVYDAEKGSNLCKAEALVAPCDY